MAAPNTSCQLDWLSLPQSLSSSSGLSVDILTFDGWTDFVNRRYFAPVFEDTGENFHTDFFTYKILVVNSDLYGNNTPTRVDILDFNESLRPTEISDYSSYLKHRRIKSSSTVIDKLEASLYPVDSNGRINLGSLTEISDDYCYRVFYGTIHDQVVKEYPVYRICYLPLTTANKAIAETINVPAKASLIELRTYTDYQNIRGPIIIPDNISISSNRGVSKVPESDQKLCPPNVERLFNCTDVDFDEVNSEDLHIKTIDIINEGNVELSVVDILVDNVSIKSGQNNLYFTIGDFVTGGSLFEKSPANLPFTPFTLGVNETKTFNVRYTPNGNFNEEHSAKITYVVQTKENPPIPVVLLKNESFLRGTSYLADVFCSDIDWGYVDGTIPTHTITGSIQNRGNKEIVLSEYKIQGKDSTYFENVSIQTPVTIPAGTTYNYSVEYNPYGSYDVLHLGSIGFTFNYTEPGQTTPSSILLKTKVTSNLSAKAFIDDLWDGFGDDENEVFVDKVFSKVIDVSLPVSKNRTYPLWKCNSEKLNTFFTSSNGTKLDKYFLSVYDGDHSDVRSFKEFEISYGHIDGSGSLYLEGETNIMPSKAMYSKYKVDTFGIMSGSFGEVQPFTFKNGIVGRSVYFIQFDRDMFRDMIDPGNFQLSLAPLSSSADQLINTGSNFYVDPSSSITYTLIDDSFDTKQRNTDQFSLRTHYNLVSGSLKDGVYGEPGDNAWGMFFPQSGLIVLDGAVLDQSCSFNTVTASIDGDNIRKLFLSISGSAAYSENRVVTESFFARSAERNIVQTYFCRVDQDEFNYSNNPTYVSGSNNEIKNSFFVKEPQTYITSVGLYNRQRELIAIGKLKRPLLKKQNTNYVFAVRVRIM